MTFIEVLILFDENFDKFFPERCLYMWFFNLITCKDNPNISNDIVRIFKLFLNNKYINSEVKKKIFYNSFYSNFYNFLKAYII